MSGTSFWLISFENCLHEIVQIVLFVYKNWDSFLSFEQFFFLQIYVTMVPTNVTVQNDKKLKKHLNIYTLREHLIN